MATYATEFGEIRQNNGHYALQKVIQGHQYVGANQKLICDFLLAINTILHPILHRFQVASDRGMSHFNGLAEGDPLRISP